MEALESIKIQSHVTNIQFNGNSTIYGIDAVIVCVAQLT